MTHDPLCERPNGPNYALCYCTLIARVREDEQNKYADMANVHWNAGYAWGISDSLQKIQDISDKLGGSWNFWLKEAIRDIETLYRSIGEDTNNG